MNREEIIALRDWERFKKIPKADLLSFLSFYGIEESITGKLCRNMGKADLWPLLFPIIKRERMRESS